MLIGGIKRLLIIDHLIIHSNGLFEILPTSLYLLRIAKTFNLKFTENQYTEMLGFVGMNASLDLFSFNEIVSIIGFSSTVRNVNDNLRLLENLPKETYSCYLVFTLENNLEDSFLIMFDHIINNRMDWWLKEKTIREFISSEVMLEEFENKYSYFLSDTKILILEEFQKKKRTEFVQRKLDLLYQEFDKEEDRMRVISLYLRNGIIKGLDYCIEWTTVYSEIHLNNQK